MTPAARLVEVVCKTVISTLGLISVVLVVTQ